jgi:Cysteine rich repeat
MAGRAYAVAAIFMLASSAANAQSPAEPSWRAACNADLAQFCGEVQSGGGRLRECLRQDFRELSPGCKRALREARQQRRQEPPQEPAEQ